MISTLKCWLFLLFTTLFISQQGAAQNQTPQYWKCENKVGGEWNFGLIPNACDISPFIDPAQAQLRYQPVIFDQDASRTEERNRYMQEMYSTIRDFSDYYLIQRKPNVSQAEKQAWQKAIYTIAHQESFWSHYRFKSEKMKMVRGDYGHGHGIMQIDDRWHFSKVKDGVAAKFIQNLIYALEIYYNAWEKAPSKSCVSSSTNWKSRTRSAYSVYNGGGGSYCRWTNPNHRWAKNDKNFYDKFKSKTWLQYVSDTTKPAKLNVRCLAEDKPNCTGENSRTDNSFVSGRFYETKKGKVCAYKNGKFHCIESSKDMACLNLFLGTNSRETQKIDAQKLVNKKWISYDRHQICVDNVSSLLPIQNHAITEKPVSLLSATEGNQLQSLLEGEQVLILDFEVKNTPGYPIYYKVNWKSQTGYVHAGSHASPQQVFTALAKEDDLKFLAHIGDTVKVKNSGGINQRESIKGKYIQNISKNTELEVLDRELRGTEGRSYFLVSHKGKIGYIYAGQLNPNTVYSWTSIVNRKQPLKKARLKPHLWYMMPKSCQSEGCENTSKAIWGKRQNRTCDQCALFEVLEEKGDWARVYSHNNGAQGWIKKEVMDEL